MHILQRLLDGALALIQLELAAAEPHGSTCNRNLVGMIPSPSAGFVCP